MYDELTGLYNRSKFFLQLHMAVHNTAESGAQVGLLVIDIQRFRKINRHFGYDTGNSVLQSVADVLKQVSREGDYLARIGDDQFALLLTRIANIGHARLAAMKIQRLLEPPIQAAGSNIRCKTVIGIGLYPDNASNATALLQAAEQAMDMAKSQEQPIGFIENQDKKKIAADWDLEIMLSESIARSELEVFFQPKISLHTGHPVGAEALVRWNNTSRGMVSPGDFMPIADASGFSKTITNWMLNSALRLSSSWPKKWGKLSVSVNIPPNMFEESNFVDLVMSTKKLWQCDNITLCLEVLEQSMISGDKVTAQKLCALRKLGIKISIDDFGTGYSSLSYFRDIPADELKIDQSFIKNLKGDKSNVHIVSLIIELARRFGLAVIAEGVEDRDAVIFLKKKGCDLVQGYYIAKPMPAALFPEWLATFQPELAFRKTGS